VQTCALPILAARVRIVDRAHEIDVAVNLIGPLERVAGAQVQSVDILSDEHEAIGFASRRELLLESRKREVSFVRLRGATETASIQVPAPDFIAHALEGRDRKSTRLNSSH